MPQECFIKFNTIQPPNGAHGLKDLHVLTIKRLHTSDINIKPVHHTHYDVGRRWSILQSCYICYNAATNAINCTLEVYIFQTFPEEHACLSHPTLPPSPRCMLAAPTSGACSLRLGRTNFYTLSPNLFQLLIKGKQVLTFQYGLSSEDIK